MSNEKGSERVVLRLSDNVIARVVQILQEGLMTGTDITDHMRMIRLESDGSDNLQLTPEYVKQVQDGFDKINAEAEKLASMKVDG
jgi:hypothetical protein